MNQKGSSFALIILIVVILFAASVYVVVSTQSTPAPIYETGIKTSLPKPAESTATSSAQNKKMDKYGVIQNTQNCAGTYLYSDKNPILWGYILEKDYGFNAIKELAQTQGMEVKIQEDYSYLSRTVEDAKKYYKLGLDLKDGDVIEKGPLLIKVLKNEVKITGPRMEIFKNASSEEKYQFTLSYLPDEYLKQGIQVTQNGSCDFLDGYVRAQVVSLLDSIGIESTWVWESKVGVNYMGSVSLSN